MRAYVADFNNILLELKGRVNLAETPRDADVLILWQDVRGHMKELCEINHNYLGIPVVVVQHGRGATRDYLPPNSFPLLADKMCVWGSKEFERMDKAGHADKCIITGSPLLNLVKKTKRTSHSERIIIFTPVITSHEEAENLEVYYELKKLEYTYAQEKLRKYKSQLKEHWDAWAINPECATEDTIPYDVLRSDFYLISKLTTIHDQRLYHGPIIRTHTYNKKHIEDSLKVLSQTDIVVGIEEGTFQLIATALGIPTIVIDGFEYGSYGGVKNYKTEIIHSKATAFCNLRNLRETIESELKSPLRRQNARFDVVREEFGDMDSDPVENIINVASELCQGDIRKKEEICQQNSPLLTK